MAVTLWGTFSVVDHLRSHPFVADVLLYDRLALPVPTDELERKRWAERHRQPDLQAGLLKILGNHAVAVPWSLEMHHQWAAMFEREVPQRTKREVAVDPMTRAVAFDANNVVEARRRTMAEQSTRAEDPDDPGLMVTRVVLADHFNQERDRAILDGIPSVSEVQAVTAYGSYRDFRARKGEVVAEPNRAGTRVMTFNWPFLVPADSERTPQDLLKQAVELADTNEVRAWRGAAHRWRVDAMLRGLSDVAAAQELEGLISDYRRAAKRLRIVTRTKWAVTLGGAVAGLAAAAVFPPAGIVAASAAFGSFIPAPGIPQDLEAGAMFYEARRRFS